MSLYPESVARCQHIKVNGTQCGSPALRQEKYCYFHMRWCLKNMEINSGIQQERWEATMPLLEDANSVQMGVGEVMRLMLTRQVDHRTAALMLYGLQTASINMKHTSFEPEPTRVVIDRECVQRRPIGATAWSALEGCEYDELESDGLVNGGLNEDGSCGEDIKRLIDLAAGDPEYMEKRARDLSVKQEREELRRFHAGLPLR
jgi:hypothetical protein